MRGSVRNLKKNIHPQNRKKTTTTTTTTTTTIRSKTENRMQNRQTYKSSYPSSQNLNRSDTVLTCEAHRGFAAFRDQRRRIMTALVEEKPESK